MILSKAENCAKSLGSNRGSQILFGNRKNGSPHKKSDCTETKGKEEKRRKISNSRSYSAGPIQVLFNSINVICLLAYDMKSDEGSN